MGLMWVQCGTHVGPIWAGPTGTQLGPRAKTHVGPTWAAHLGPIWVLYGRVGWGFEESYGGAVREDLNLFVRIFQELLQS